MSRGDPRKKAKITKSLMAMSNIRDEAYIITYPQPDRGDCAVEFHPIKQCFTLRLGEETAAYPLETTPSIDPKEKNT